MSSRAPALRVLMTLDAVGGVWRYAMDLGRGMRDRGMALCFLGFGPRPDAARAAEARAIGTLDWADAPLDWMIDDAAALAGVAGSISAAVQARSIDVVHLNLPSQAAGLRVPVPVVAVSHSCVVTWFRAVRGTRPPASWGWQRALNARGLAAADVVVAPSEAHAALLRRAYGAMPRLRVVRNGVGAATPSALPPSKSVVAAGRWWDEGKDAATLDAAAALLPVPVEAIGPTCSPAGEIASFRHAAAVGELGHAETLARIAAARIFVSPSIYEPFGLAVAEAARATRPLVLSDIATFRELWDGSALFFPPGDAAALASRVGDLLSDGRRAERLGRAARARARSFSLERQVDAMLALYAEAARASEPACAAH